MKTIDMYLTITMLILSIGCSKDEAKQPIVSPQDKEFTTINNGSLGGNGNEGIPQSNMVINDTTDWESLMSKMNTVNNVTDNFSETDIDFDNYSIIAIFLEVKASGWEVKITNITEHENSVVISTKETQFITAVVTQPFSIVKIRRTEKNIVFE